MKAIFLLDGRAFKFVEGLPKEKTESLPALVEALYARYLGPGTQKDAREELRIIRRRSQEKPEDYGQRIQELARVAFPGNMQQQKEEGVAAFRDGIKDDRMAEGIVLQQYKTVQECVNALANVERYRHGAGKEQPKLRLRQLEGEQTVAQSQGQSQGPTEQRLASVEEKLGMLLDAFYKKEQRELNMGRGQPQSGPGGPGQGQSQQGPGQGSQQQNFQGGGRGYGRSRRPYVERPSAEQPCRICKATDHWERRCPQRNSQMGAGADRGPVDQQNNQYQGNAGGLDPRSGAQSDQRK